MQEELTSLIWTGKDFAERILDRSGNHGEAGSKTGENKGGGQQPSHLPKWCYRTQDTPGQ